MNKKIFLVFILIFIVNIFTSADVNFDPTKNLTLIKNTYFISDISTGYLFAEGINNSVILGYEFYDRNFWTIDLILGDGLYGIAVDRKFTSIFEIKLGLSVVRKNSETKLGINFLHTKF